MAWWKEWALDYEWRFLHICLLCRLLVVWFWTILSFLWILVFLSIIWLADFQGFLLPVVTISNSSYKAKEESQTEWVGKAEVAVFGNLIWEVTSITLAEFQTLEANHQAQPTLKRRGLFRGRNARRQGSLFSFFLCFSTVVIDHYLFKNWEIWERGPPRSPPGSVT